MLSGFKLERKKIYFDIVFVGFLNMCKNLIYLYLIFELLLLFK